MKQLLLILVLVCQTALAECDIRSAAQMTGEYNIGPVKNLTKDTSILGQCYVQYDIVVKEGEVLATVKIFESNQFAGNKSFFAHAIIKFFTKLLLTMSSGVNSILVNAPM